MKRICPICQKPVNETKSGKESTIHPIELDYAPCHLSCYYKNKKKPELTSGTKE